MLRFFWDEVVALDPAMVSKDERNMKLSREGQLGELWNKAGLVNVQEKPLVIDQAYTSFDDYWGPFLNGAGPGVRTWCSLLRNTAVSSRRACESACSGTGPTVCLSSKRKPGACRGKFPRPPRSFFQLFCGVGLN